MSLVAHFIPGQGETLVGNKLSVWEDIVGGYTWNQATDANRPVKNNSDPNFGGTPSYTFDGSSFMEFANNTDLDLASGSLAMAVLLYPANVNTIFRIIGKNQGGVSPGHNIYAEAVATSRLVCGMVQGGAHYRAWASANSVFTREELQMVAADYTLGGGGGANNIRNAVNHNTSAINNGNVPTSTTNTNKTWLGKMPTSTGDEYQGEVGEIVFYDNVPTWADVYAEMLANLVPAQSSSGRSRREQIIILGG